MQMGNIVTDTLKYNADSGSMVTNLNSKHEKGKRFLDGPMNKEELKMNKQLLNEIGLAKKKLGDYNASSKHNSPSKSQTKAAAL